MKIISLVLAVFCYTLLAQYAVAGEPNKIPFIINYDQYLSESAKKQISIKIAKSIIEEKIKNGTIFDNIGVETEAISFSIPVSFTKERDYSKNFKVGENYANSSVSSSGNIECWNIRADNPHLGEEFPYLPDKPKAKATAECKYVHSTGVEYPPWINFELRQVLFQYRIRNNPVTGAISMSQVGEFAKIYPKQGLEVKWWPNGSNQTGTQIFGKCPLQGESDFFVHNFQIYVSPPPGWDYFGPVPHSVSGDKTNYISCP